MRDKFAQAIALLKKGFQGLTGDVSVAAGSTTATIPNDTVTFAKMQNVTGPVLIGRETASAGDLETVAIGSGLAYSSGTLSASGGLSTWQDVMRIQLLPTGLAINGSHTFSGWGSTIKIPSATTTKYANAYLIVVNYNTGGNFALNHPRFSSVNSPLGGYRYTGVYLNRDLWGATEAFFVGMANTYPTQPANTVSNQLGNMTLTGIGFGGQSSSANYKLVHSDGGGTRTVTDTGISILADDMFIVTIEADPGATSVDVSLEVVGRSTYTATLSSNIPASTVLLMPVGGVRAPTGTDAGQIGLMFIDCIIT